MSEFLYHALGFCGEHWHPNAINMTALALTMYMVYQYKKTKA
jgi:hypothetical protein